MGSVVGIGRDRLLLAIRLLSAGAIRAGVLLRGDRVRVLRLGRIFFLGGRLVGGRALGLWPAVVLAGRGCALAVLGRRPDGRRFYSLGVVLRTATGGRWSRRRRRFGLLRGL